jgi:hypothetical protein
MTEPPPWLSIGDVGQLGLETAAAVVERLLHVTRQVGDLRLPLFPSGPDPAATRRLRADAERLIDLYAEWTRLLVEVSLDGAAPTRSPDVLTLGPVAPAGTAQATVWFHVLDGPGAGPATLRATDLTAHDGSRVLARAVGFDPPALPTGSPRTSHEVAVRVSVPRRTRPGLYHGHLLAAGLAEVSLPVRLTVDDTGRNGTRHTDDRAP